MKLPNWINSQMVLVRVDREKQSRHREKIGALYANPLHVFLKQNLQYGQVIVFGSRIKELIPELRPWDLLLFHHCIEGSLQNSSRRLQEGNARFIYDDEDKMFRYYIVPYEHIYGFYNGKLFSTKDFLLCTQISRDDRTLVGNSFLQFKNFKENRHIVEQRLDAMKQEVMILSRSGGNKELNKKRAEGIMMDMQRMTAELNKKKLEPFQIEASNSIVKNAKIAWYNMVGESPTSITIDEKEYSVLRMKHVGITE